MAALTYGAMRAQGIEEYGTPLHCWLASSMCCYHLRRSVRVLPEGDTDFAENLTGDKLRIFKHRGTAAPQQARVFTYTLHFETSGMTEGKVSRGSGATIRSTQLYGT
eukprot:gb/GFBE01051243.1/.p1 GENE.gb/GFBE01051243.1/~~gb/GFBE01051243.1/.p1  ORF type:complete len:107 (+),score=5.38 gb/GFBE01051243.1/:1-321(+)